MERSQRRRMPSRFTQKSSDDESESEEDVPARPGKKQKQDDVWVCCDKCGKWRRLPPTTDPKRLPRRWYCTMNPDSSHNQCSAPEEDYHSKTRMSLKDQRLQNFLGGWVRRLQRIEELEQRLPTNYSMGTRGKKRALSEMEWIQCSNPACGKWRAISRCHDSRHIFENHREWFCVMNTWDEALASCAAPQEIPERYCTE